MEACTFGIWISQPIPLPTKEGQDKEYMVVVDSEGTDVGQTTHHPKILALACLLACNGGVSNLITNYCYSFEGGKNRLLRDHGPLQDTDCII